MNVNYGFSDSAAHKRLRSLRSPSVSLGSHGFGSRMRLMLIPPRHLFLRPLSRKTLILDLDETLIHSFSRGGRMGATQMRMIEVRLSSQLATLYYVHKRPYCDEFLKQMSQWYNLVIFTASVKEYADPIIDWLEQEGVHFTKRLYRNNCTLASSLPQQKSRTEGYIKDISTVEPDLSKVIIVDNSPISYEMHKDNAVMIEGWVNDPTDADLLHLIPVLKALNHVSDVRSLLSLKRGEEACMGTLQERSSVILE